MDGDAGERYRRGGANWMVVVEDGGDAGRGHSTVVRAERWHGASAVRWMQTAAPTQLHTHSHPFTHPRQSSRTQSQLSSPPRPKKKPRKSGAHRGGKMTWIQNGSRGGSSGGRSGKPRFRAAAGKGDPGPREWREREVERSERGRYASVSGPSADALGS